MGGGSSSGCRDPAAVPVRRRGQWAPGGLLGRCFPSAVRNATVPQTLSPTRASQGEEASSVVILFTHVHTRTYSFNERSLGSDLRPSPVLDTRATDVAKTAQVLSPCGPLTLWE